MQQTIETKVSGKAPFIQSPLLYTKADGTLDFVHDTFKDYFLAKYFAEEIKHKKIRAEEVYTDYLLEQSLVTSTKRVNGKISMPRESQILEFLCTMLQEDDLLEIVISLCEAGCVEEDIAFRISHDAEMDINKSPSLKQRLDDLIQSKGLAYDFFQYFLGYSGKAQSYMFANAPEDIQNELIRRSFGTTYASVELSSAIFIE